MFLVPHRLLSLVLRLLLRMRLQLQLHLQGHGRLHFGLLLMLLVVSVLVLLHFQLNDTLLLRLGGLWRPLRRQQGLCIVIVVVVVVDIAVVVHGGSSHLAFGDDKVIEVTTTTTRIDTEGEARGHIRSITIVDGGVVRVAGCVCCRYSCLVFAGWFADANGGLQQRQQSASRHTRGHVRLCAPRSSHTGGVGLVVMMVVVIMTDVVVRRSCHCGAEHWRAGGDGDGGLLRVGIAIITGDG